MQDNFSTECDMDNNDIVNYEVSSPTQNVNGNINEFYGDSESEFYSNLFGGLKKALKKRSQQRSQRKMIREKSKAQTRILDAKSKIIQQKASQKQADANAKGMAGENDLAAALAKDSGSDSGAKTTEPAGMSMTTKILIGVGIVTVLGIVGFIVYKKMHNKGK